MKERTYISIDIKSFFASVECVKRNLDPYKTPFIVADSHQGNSAITLAITPYLKTQGLNSRCRLYEIPKNIKYTIIDPDMNLYKEYSKKIVDIYKKYIDSKDIHIYSIDECFIDVTPYLSLYNITAKNLAYKIITDIKNTTGLSASCGISKSIFLAKVAMDTEGKKSNDIAIFKDENDLEKIKDLSSIWGIGKSTKKKLSNLQLFSVNDIKTCDINYLEKKLGLVGIKLWNNLNGIYSDTIESLNKEPKNKSMSMSKHLLKEYTKEEIIPLIFKMCSSLEYRLYNEKKEFETINFKILYSDLTYAINKTINTKGQIHTERQMYELILNTLDKLKITNIIKSIEINLLNIKEKQNIQLSIFRSKEVSESDKVLSKTMYDIKNKYGFDSISTATNIIKHNKM